MKEIVGSWGVIYLPHMPINTTPKSKGKGDKKFRLDKTQLLNYSPSLNIHPLCFTPEQLVLQKLKINE
jgi:hypothetical protein